MLTGPDPFFPNPNVNGKKRSGYARLTEGAGDARLLQSMVLCHGTQVFGFINTVSRVLYSFYYPKLGIYNLVRAVIDKMAGFDLIIE